MTTETDSHDEVIALNERIDSIEKMVCDNRDDVKELLSIFRASKGFLRVLGWMGVAVKWIIVVGGFLVAMWAYVSGHNKGGL